MSKQADRSKKKEPTQGAAKMKRTHEGGEVEPARKKTLQGPRLVHSIELREVAPFTAQVLALLASQGEGSYVSPSFPWT